MDLDGPSSRGEAFVVTPEGHSRDAFHDAVAEGAGHHGVGAVRADDNLGVEANGRAIRHRFDHHAIGKPAHAFHQRTRPEGSSASHGMADQDVVQHLALEDDTETGIGSRGRETAGEGVLAIEEQIGLGDAGPAGADDLVEAAQNV